MFEWINLLGYTVIIVPLITIIYAFYTGFKEQEEDEK